jgi:hypothetical protein
MGGEISSVLAYERRMRRYNLEVIRVVGLFIGKPSLARSWGGSRRAFEHRITRGVQLGGMMA